MASSNTAVATVSARGIITAVSIGAVDISATLQEVSGRGHVDVQRITFEIVGSVHETAPTQDVGIAGARVEVVGGALDGQSTNTDGSGNFRLAGVVDAGFALKVKTPGYDDGQYDVVSLPRDGNANVALMPTSTIVTEDRRGSGSVGAVCQDDPMFPVWEFTVHQTGPARLITAENVGGGSALYIAVFQVKSDGTLKDEWTFLAANLPYVFGPLGLSTYWPPPGGPPSELVGGFKYRLILSPHADL